VNIQYEIRFYIKTPESKTLTILVDGKLLNKHKGKYIWTCNGGNHRLRIEQDKMFKYKWFWIYAPLIFLMGIIGGDFETDGKTPFYAAYEADVFIDKNLEVNISLFDTYRYTDVSKQDLEYKIKVNFSEEVNFNIVNDKFSVTKKEQVKWFLMNTFLISLLIGLIVFVGIGAGFSSLTIGAGLSGAIFSWFISAIFIVIWIFFVYKLYRNSKGEFKK
jgi:hypothetical protein